MSSCLLYLKEQNHGLSEGLKVVDVVQPAPVLDVHEEGHPEDGKDEHDEEEQQADVEQRGHGHGQCEEQGSDSPSSLDQSQNSTDFGHSHHSQQGWRHKVFFNQVAQDNAWKRYT
jgi:hypothetical protein